MPYLLSLILLILAVPGARPLHGQAILNVERESFRETPGPHVALEGSARVSTGNDDVVEVEGGAVLGYRWERHWVRLLGGGEHLVEDGEGLIDSRYLHLRYNRIFTNRWRSFHFVQLQANQALRLQRRWLVGSGLRRVLVDPPRHRLDVGTGLMLESERLNRLDLEPDEVDTRLVRATNLASYRFVVREGVEWMNVTYFQPAMREVADFRVLNDLGLNVELAEWLGVELQLRWRHDSQPPARVESNDLTFATAFTVSLW